MRTTWVFSGVLAAAVMLGIGGQAQAGPASYQIQITGYVPVICRASATTSQVQPGQTVSLGDLTEFCNNGAGYQVWVDYTPGVTGSTIYVDGTAIPLSTSGSTMIDSSSTAASRIRTLSLDAGSGLTSISMRVVPL